MCEGLFLTSKISNITRGWPNFTPRDLWVGKCTRFLILGGKGVNNNAAGISHDRLYLGRASLGVVVKIPALLSLTNSLLYGPVTIAGVGWMGLAPCVYLIRPN